MKKPIILFLFIASGLFAQTQSYDGGYFQKNHWTLISATLLSASYDISVDATKKIYLDGGGDTYIHEVSSNKIEFFVGGSARWFMSGGQFTFATSAPRLDGDPPTPTNPNIVPNNLDVNTGPSWARQDQQSLTSGGIEAQRISEGDGEVSTILSGTVVETITDATSAGDATLTKAGENFDVTCSVGDAVLVYGGTTAGDYGTYIITAVTSATVLTLDRALAGSDADVDFDIVADGVIIENSTTTGVATLRVPQFTQYLTIVSGQATVGSTAPTVTTVGTYRGLSFDADAELVFFEFEVPDDWNGVSDMTLKAYWTNEAGDALADGETVKFDFDYRSRAEGEALDGGSAVSVSGTYTQSGAGTDKELIEGQVTLDYDHADQPLTKGDLIGIKANRDMTTDSYAGDITIFKWEIAYTAYTFSLHN